MNQIITNSLRLDGVSKKFGAVGILLVVICIAGGFSNKSEFYQSYLVAFLFWLGITLGCLAVLMIQHLTGGQWALVIRRILEAATRTLPLMVIAAIPLLVGMKTLYVWSLPGQTDPSIVGKHLYLNTEFFVIRMILYFAIWLTMAHFFNKWSRLEDQGDTSVWMYMENLGGIGLLIYALTVTFASIDWVMSIEPRWFSTIYGMIFMVGQCLAALAFSTTVLIWLSDREPLAKNVRPTHFQDLASFLFTFIMLWAYVEFSQFLIIWGGNLSDEIPWYLRRMQGAWGTVGLLIVILSFAFPLFLLLFRHLKRKPRSLVFIAGLLLLMRLVDMYWMVLPAFGGGNVHLQWMNIVLPLGFGGIWFAFFIWQLQRMPILPVHDPRMKGVAQHGAAHG